MLVRGVPACVRMETATQVLVVCDQAGQEEWVPKSSPALTLERNSANQAARAAAAAAAAHGAPLDPTEDLSSDGEDDECCICGNGGKRASLCKVPLGGAAACFPWPGCSRDLVALRTRGKPRRRSGPNWRLRPSVHHPG